MYIYTHLRTLWQVIGYYPKQRSECVRDQDGRWAEVKGGGSFTPEQLRQINAQRARKGIGQAKM